ncbi:MAG: hypothetical protein RMJ35_00815 [Phycisphaerales bacterium]|nr:hypothetical protein [Phycisphaerales bacterium]
MCPDRLLMERRRVLLAAAAVSLASCSFAIAQLAPGTNIQTRIRPITWQQYSATDLGGGVTIEQRTALGIWDTGDPVHTFSKDTAARLGINPLGPINTNPGYAAGGLVTLNPAAVASQTITSGGWLGARFDGPERTTPAGYVDPYVRAGDPAHVLTTAHVAHTAGVATADIRPYYEDYNDRVNVNLNGTAFAARANPAQNLVTFVDPINGSPIPFRFDNSNGHGRGLATAGPADLNSRASSVSFFANNHAQVPTRTRNANPGFVHFFELIPMEFSSTTLTPSAGAGPVGLAAEFAAAPADVNTIIRVRVAAADGTATTGVIPTRNLPPGSDPGYRPHDLGIVNIFAVLDSGMFVRNATINIGGTENPNGFVRREGRVRVIVGHNNIAGNFVQDFSQDIALPSQAPLTFGRIQIPDLGIDTGPAPILLDTGAPSTDATVVGTDIFNRFGQYWDLSPRGVAPNPNRGLLTLIGPSDAGVRAAVASGMLLTVDRNTTGLARTAVNFEKTIGTVPQLNAAGPGLTLASDGVPNQAAGTVFRTHLTGSNATYIDEQASGLNRGVNGHVIDGMSLGGDGMAKDAELYFSVSPSSQGLAGSAVAAQRALNQHAADVFRSQAPRPVIRAVGIPNPPDPQPLISITRTEGNNTLYINQEVMGLAPNVGPGAMAEANSENLLDFDLHTNRALPDNALSNLDSPIRARNETPPASRPRIGNDVLGGNFDHYFSISRDAAAGPLSGATIFRNNLDTVFATAATMGLSAANDDIDALALFRPSVAPGTIGGPLQPGPQRPTNALFATGGFNIFDPNDGSLFEGIDLFNGGLSDVALFSLAPGSLTLLQFGLSPADLFITDFDGTFTLYATAEGLGLNFSDNIVGLDSIPEPSLVPLALLVLLRRRRTTGGSAG